MLIKVCDYVKDILTFDADKIVIARANYTLKDFTSDLIVVDLLTMTPLGKNESYNKVSEKLTLATNVNANITLDFYGDNALINATNFINMQQSQTAIDLQRTLGIGVFHSKNIKNVKEKVGVNYYSRYQIELVINGIISKEIDTLRIDTVDFDVLFNK